MKRAPTESLAHRLVRYYAPGANFKLLYGGREPSYAVRGDMDNPTDHIVIRWRPSTGLMSLLHELGHIRLHHLGPTHYERCLVAPIETQIIQEAAAWLWAEQKAKRWGIPFLYEAADRCFCTYTRKLAIQWRYQKRS